MTSTATPDVAALRPVDLERFWADSDAAVNDPWNPANRMVPMSLGLGYHTMFAELGLPYDMKRLDVDSDYEFAGRCARAYNELCEKVLGRRFTDEQAYNPDRQYPRVRELGEIFECRRIWHSDSWWLTESATTPAELDALLDRVERKDLYAEMFPDNWERRCREIYERYGKPPAGKQAHAGAGHLVQQTRPHGHKPVLGKRMRGPVTLATSICGVENLLYWLMDEPTLMARFREVMKDTILRYFDICEQMSDPAGIRPGFNFNDDNCALVTPEMYETFALPIVTAVFERFAPGPRDRRHQHSDSDMAHVMPLLNRAGLNSTNFGPNVSVAQIRAALPNAIIRGELAPFTLMRNNEDAIIAEVRRDVRQGGIGGGLVLGSAGSVNDGTRLSSIRTVMWALQTFAHCDSPRNEAPLGAPKPHLPLQGEQPVE